MEFVSSSRRCCGSGQYAPARRACVVRRCPPRRRRVQIVGAVMCDEQFATLFEQRVDLAGRNPQVVCAGSGAVPVRDWLPSAGGILRGEQRPASRRASLPRRVLRNKRHRGFAYRCEVRPTYLRAAGNHLDAAAPIDAAAPLSCARRERVEPRSPYVPRRRRLLERD